MKAGIKSSARAERVAASDKLQLHEKPSYLRRSRAIAGEGRPTKRWIARDERKFPAEVFRTMANNSVTSGLNGCPAFFIISIITACFPGVFCNIGPACDDSRWLSPKSRCPANIGALPRWQHKAAHSARRRGCGGTVVRFRANEFGIVAALAVALGGGTNGDFEDKDGWGSKAFEFVSRKRGSHFSELHV